MDAHSTHVSLENRAHAWLAEEERILHEQLLLVRSAMNEQLPIYQLPEEVVLEILDFVRLSLFPSHEWIWVTHVSRRWRDIALASPIFWSLIGAYPSSLISACLKRAKDVPLTLIYERRGPTLDGKLDWIKPHAQRFVTVKLSLDPAAMMRLEETEFYEFSWDNLEVLSLRSRHKDDFTPGQLDVFFASPPPKLRSFELVRMIAQPWRKCCSLQNLRILKLRELYRRSIRYGPTMNEFLDVLEGCILLEELEFDSALPPTANTNDRSHPETRRRIELKHLQKATICYERELDTAFFLAQLCFPQTAQLHIISEGPSSPDDLSRSVISYLPRDLRDLKMMDLVNHVHISITSTLHGTWRILNVTASNTEDPQEKCTRVRLTQGYKGDNFEALLRGLFRSLKNMFAAYPGVQIVVFSFGCLTLELSGITQDDWYQVLTAFPSPLYLGINMLPEMPRMEEDAEPLRILLRVLELGQTPSSSSTQTSPAMPSLEAFAINDISPDLADAIQADAVRCARYRAATSSDPGSFQFLVNDRMIRPESKFLRLELRDLTKEL